MVLVLETKNQLYQVRAKTNELCCKFLGEKVRTHTMILSGSGGAMVCLQLAAASCSNKALIINITNNHHNTHPIQHQNFVLCAVEGSSTNVLPKMEQKKLK